MCIPSFPCLITFIGMHPFEHLPDSSHLTPEIFITWDTGNSEELIPYGNKTSVDGWHHIQFSGGKESPRKFELTLFWSVKTMPSADNVDRTVIQDQRPLLKLRTDVNRLTPKAERVLAKLPTWCSLFGKSTSPLTLAFLSSLPVNF